MNNYKFGLVYIVLITLAIYTPHFNVYDKMAVQNFIISIINTLTIITIPFLFKEVDIKKTLKHPLLILYCGYLLFSILSVFKAINVVESLVRLGQLFTFATSLFLVVFFVKRRLIKINSILLIISISICIDMFFSLRVYIPFLIEGTPYTYESNILLTGLYGNRNILATILFFKIPFIIMLSARLKNKYLSFLSFFIITIAFFNIILLSSRATYLSILLCSLLIITLLIIKYLRFKKNNISSLVRLCTLYFLPMIIAFNFSNSLIDNSDQANVLNRVSSIGSSNDVSKNTRLRYYNHSFSHLIQNPFLGGGIGNWKILSVKYDSENIKNYIIPYNAHNDILEAGAETGIFGGLFFLSFFVFLLKYLYNFIQKWLTSLEVNLTNLLILLPFITYFIDLNLNFPSSRPSNQVLYLLYIAFVLTLNYQNEKD